MTILRVGSNSKYADGWDRAFGKKKATSKASAKATSGTKKEAAPAPAPVKKKKKTGKR